MVVALGLVIGSFLNVVILRLPVMMQVQWRRDCCELLQQAPAEEEEEEFNLLVPRSRCPHCKRMIRALENIPVVSYLLLRGRCRGCARPISWRYPVIEMTSAVLALTVGICLGLTWQMFFALILSWSLLCLSMIDMDHYLLPDSITIPLLWLGLIVNYFDLFTDLGSSLFGAVFGYLSLWLVYQGFKWITGKEGMGYGDFKLLAALGAWLGWQMLPLIILLSSLLGSCVFLLLMAGGQWQKSSPIPFGPWLAVGGWVTLLWGYPLVGWLYQ